MLYRNLYEATDPECDLLSHLDGRERRGRSGERAAETWAERRRRLARTVAVIEAKGAASRSKRPRRACAAGVGGHARCLGAMMGGGGSHAARKRTLVTALDVCAAHFGVCGAAS
jgi:hypothetical protein